MTKGFVFLFTLAFLITLSLIVIKPAFIASVTPVKAETVIETIASLSAEPNPVGVGQEVQLSMVIEPPPPTPTDRFSGFIINITRPDNATELIGPYLSDSNGSAHDIYLPAKYGIYKLQLNYSGESFAGGIVYKGTASAIITLNVTQEPQPVPTPSPTPEPTPAPTPTPEPTPPPSPSPAPQSTATPSPQPQQSPTATPSPEPTPELPEFPSWIILPAFITATLVAGIVYRRKRSRQLLFNFPNNIQNFG